MGGVVPTINNFCPRPEKPMVIQAGWVKITSAFLVQLSSLRHLVMDTLLSGSVLLPLPAPGPVGLQGVQREGA